MAKQAQGPNSDAPAMPDPSCRRTPCQPIASRITFVRAAEAVEDGQDRGAVVRGNVHEVCWAGAEVGQARAGQRAEPCEVTGAN
jgi:hypothetical protein